MSRTTTLRLAAVISGFLIAILMTMGVSRALFTNPTSNDANAWSSGNVVLVNEGALTDGGSPTFDETGSAIFTVTFDSAAPNTVQNSTTNDVELE